MKVLIIEDEKNLAHTINQCICNNYDTELTYDGYEGYMLARLEAILRRSNKLYKNEVLKFKEMELNIKNRQVTINGEAT